MTTQHEEDDMTSAFQHDYIDMMRELEQDRQEGLKRGREEQRKADLRLVRQMLAAVYEPHEYEEVMRRLEHG